MSDELFRRILRLEESATTPETEGEREARLLRRERMSRTLDEIAALRRAGEDSEFPEMLELMQVFEDAGVRPPGEGSR